MYYLLYLEMYIVIDMLYIECVDGQEMFYFGYISVIFIFYGIQLDSLSDCFFFIVFISIYSIRILVFIGINIIIRLFDVIRDEFGFRFLQDVDLYIFWYLVFRCMIFRERELRRNGNRFGIVKFVEVDRIIIFFNGSVVIKGYLEKKFFYYKVFVMF